MSSNDSFISYRRETGWSLARLVYQNLCAHGYDVFLDVESIGAGSFKRVIDGQIRARPYFLPIFTSGALDRCVDPTDVLRGEMEKALQTRRCIVPLVTDEFNRQDISSFLPPDMAEKYRSFNTITIVHEYFNAAMNRLRRHFLQPIDIAIEPIDAELEPESERLSKAAASKAPIEATVEKSALKVQKHFERAIAAVKTDPDLAIKEFGESSNLLQQSNSMQLLMDDFNLQYQELQTRMKRENAAFSHLSELMKIRNETVKASISSVR
jgi:hypothetical protein